MYLNAFTPWQALSLQPALYLHSLCSTVCPLYVHISETKKKYFTEEISDESVVIGNYRTQLWHKKSQTVLPSSLGLGMHCFIFTSHTPGEHQICLHFNFVSFCRWSRFRKNRRYKEERFRLTRESTNQRVLWWSISQTIISFFEVKKLI
uniref:Transmembrane p24 trafficking protein 4 n=1 Tax=Callorhinchus milii TaxID=7868 RepID=A0A4W3I166_CALMI